MVRHASLAALAVTTLVACAPTGGESLSDAERLAIADSVKAISAAWKGAAERADAAGVLGYYLNSPETAVARADNADQTTLAFEVFASGLPTGLQRIRSQVLNLTDQRVTVLSRDAVAETAIGDWAETDTTGQVTKTHFAYSRTWVKRDGGWKILHSHLANAPTPPAPTPQR